MHYDEDDERTNKIGDMKVVKKLFKQVSRGEFKEVADYINKLVKKSVKKNEDGSSTTLNTCIFCKNCQPITVPITCESEIVFSNEVVTHKTDGKTEIFLKDKKKKENMNDAKDAKKDTKQLIPIFGQLTSSSSGSINLFEVFEETTRIYHLNDVFIGGERFPCPLKLDLRNLFIKSIPVLPFSLRNTDKHDMNTLLKQFI